MNEINRRTKHIETDERSSLAISVISYCLNSYDYSLSDIANAAGVTRMTINNWLNGHDVRQKNLANLIINLDVEPVIGSIINPSKFEDNFDAKAIKKYAQLKNEWTDLQSLIEVVKLEKLDCGYLLRNKKYFQIFGIQMIDAALRGEPSFSIQVRLQAKSTRDQWLESCPDIDFDDPETLDVIFDEVDDDQKIIAELQGDGFEAEVVNYSLVISESTSIIMFDCDLLIGWAMAPNSKKFGWFLEWLHIPGLNLIEKIFKKIKSETMNSLFKLELPFYSITNEDYDDDGNTDLKDDYISYLDDEESLYYNGVEIPVHESILKEFFSIKGFKFSIKRDARGSNQHIAVIDWS